MFRPAVSDIREFLVPVASAGKNGRCKLPITLLTGTKSRIPRRCRFSLHFLLFHWVQGSPPGRGDGSAVLTRWQGLRPPTAGGGGHLWSGRPPPPPTREK